LARLWLAFGSPLATKFYQFLIFEKAINLIKEKKTSFSTLARSLANIALLPSKPLLVA
jgi:hypothetical protein